MTKCALRQRALSRFTVSTSPEMERTISVDMKSRLKWTLRNCPSVCGRERRGTGSLCRASAQRSSRLFIDQKVPRDERDTMPVVTGQDHQIIAVGTIYNIMKTRGNHSR